MLLKGEKMRMSGSFSFSFFILLCWSFIAIFSENANAQLTNTFITGAKKGEIDTLAFERAQSIIEDSKGLMEKEVDPATYIIGPGDEFYIEILSVNPVFFKQEVTPEGTFIVPKAGSIMLKDKTLLEAQKLIRDKINNAYNAREVHVTLSDIRKFKVIVSGLVRKPAIVAATPMERVSEIIEKAGGMTEKSSLRRIRLLRENSKPIIVDLQRFYMLGDKDANPYLRGGDQIIIPPFDESNTIEIRGEVAQPEEFEYADTDSLSTLIKFAQGFLASSFLDSVEIVSFSGSRKILSQRFMDLNHWRDNLFDHSILDGDFPLQTGDRVYIRPISEWRQAEYVVLEGEVNYPGKYALQRNTMRISDLIDKAGGFSNDASLEAILFIRQQEMNKIDMIMERLSKMSYNEMSENEKRYYDAKRNEKEGVMAINFRTAIEDPGSSENIFLIHQDSIIVPQKKNFINVQGRVNNPGMIVYDPSFSYEDYIQMAGGFGFRADESETFIVKTKGEQFLAENKNYILEPGDYILVPTESELTFSEIFQTSLTIATQLITIAGVVVALVRI
jgi:protein involved in polysaccharide export with SLBB domain